MHRLRRRVFKDRLGWTVSVTGDMEIDPYDALGPTYLVIATDAGAVVGSVRLLPTTGPNMLADTFPVLLDGKPAPKDPSTLESSRYCVDTAALQEVGERGLHKATFLLFAAMVAWGQHTGSSSIVTVTDTRMERVLRRAGWPLARIGGAHEIGVTQAVAGHLEVSDAAAERLAAAGQFRRVSFESSLRVAA
jgi:acyl homoserine lactone synthase